MDNNPFLSDKGSMYFTEIEYLYSISSIKKIGNTDFIHFLDFWHTLIFLIGFLSH